MSKKLKIKRKLVATLKEGPKGTFNTISGRCSCQICDSAWWVQYNDMKDIRDLDY